MYNEARFGAEVISDPKMVEFITSEIKFTTKRSNTHHHYNFNNQQSGAVEACWAHNPEVRGSKPRSAKTFIGNVPGEKLRC